MVTIYSPIAQLVERLTVNQNVRGSSPRRGAKLLKKNNNLQTLPCAGFCFFAQRANLAFWTAGRNSRLRRFDWFLLMPGSESGVTSGDSSFSCYS